MASDPVEMSDRSWPHCSLAAARAALTAPGSRFEMATVDIGGVPTRVWKNAPPSLPALFAAAQGGYGQREFVVHEGERVTYDAAGRAIAALAAYLRGAGVTKGDRVALAMRNLPEWPVAFFAATAIGSIAVPLNAWWTGPELEYALRDSGARVLIVDAERHQRLAPWYRDLPVLDRVIVARADAPTEGIATRLEEVIGAPAGWASLPDVAIPAATVAPDNDATIFYTSGTTGHPKGALGTHRNLMTNILSGGYAAARSLLRRGEEVPPPTPRTMLTVIPLFHVTACSATLMGAIATGSTLIFMRRWDTVRAMEIIECERVQVTGGVPTIAWQLLEHPARGDYDLSSLEAIAYGGAPAAPELVRRIHAEFGAMPGNGWGMTETMATVTSHAGEDYLHRPDSAGPPVAVADLEIRGEDAVSVLPVGEVGELWARGPMIVKGYWNRPDATSETFVGGWVRTGDLARLDAEGFLYIVDRARDMVIRGGENIYSTEVENALYAHPAVTDAAVIGLPHRTLGEEPVAVVHLAPGGQVSEAELQAWVRERLAAFKVPVAIAFFADTLPRNANGKILKRELGTLFERQA
jgi:acyl-CoA synthetase (AMP-forming)/AMP-acid ligase II